MEVMPATVKVTKHVKPSLLERIKFMFSPKFTSMISTNEKVIFIKYVIKADKTVYAYEIVIGDVKLDISPITSPAGHA